MTEDTTSKPADDEEAPDAKGATEDEVRRIDTIDGTESLGYDGEGREEHSGQNEPVPNLDPESDLADNEPHEIEKEEE